MPYADPAARAAYKKAWAEKNSERLRECGRVWRAKNADKLRAYRADHYQRNKDKVKEQSRLWRENNRERYRQQKREWWYTPAGRKYRESGKAKESSRRHLQTEHGRKANRERAALYRRVNSAAWRLIAKRANAKYSRTAKGKISRINTNARYRVVIRAGRVTLAEWRDILVRQDGKCRYCLKVFCVDLPPTMDHVIPVSRGGLHVASNVVAACAPCNRKKGAKLLS